MKPSQLKKILEVLKNYQIEAIKIENDHEAIYLQFANTSYQNIHTPESKHIESLYTESPDLSQVELPNQFKHPIWDTSTTDEGNDL